MPQTQQNSNCTFEHQMAHRHSCPGILVTLRNFIRFENWTGANIPLPPLSNFVSENAMKLEMHNTRFKDLDIVKSFFQ